MKGLTYKSAGVDAEAGDRLVERIAGLAARTARPEVLAGVGGFGGLFAIPPGRWKEPVLVSGTDGVGTKLKVAFAAGKHDTVGIDLVAMCANDVACSGAEPLFFLDYFATGRLEVGVAEQVIAGIARGCEQAGCALIGGETAELPGFYAPGEYDLAGFCVGCVEKARIVDGSRVQVGDALVGAASTGLHSNGFALARRALLDAPGARPDAALYDEMLTPTRIYAKDVLALADAVDLRAVAHITGGGLPGNMPRVLPRGTRARLREAAWPRPEIFDRIAREGGVERDEMFRTFNMGLGLVVAVPPGDAARAVETLRGRGVEAWAVGEVGPGAPGAEADVEIAER